MRPAPLVADGVVVQGIAGGSGLRDESMPAHTCQLGRARVTVSAQPLDRDFRRIVAAEERRVDHNPAYHAGAAEPDDSVVIADLATPPGLPAVVDLALVA